MHDYAKIFGDVDEVQRIVGVHGRQDMADRRVTQPDAICLSPWTLCAEPLPALSGLRPVPLSKGQEPPIRQAESARPPGWNRQGAAPALFFCYQILTRSLLVDNR